MMPARKAYSYLRFSTPEQMKGDSFRRQSALAEEYALRHGLDLDGDLTFRDLGVSAFRGKNAETGRLGDFLQAVTDGLVETGSFLLVESLDRISRQAARRALRVLEDIAELGVTVVTLNDGRAYDADALDNDPVTLLLALLTFIRANEESATKAKRLKAAWEGKRKKAAVGTGMTACCPAWLRLDPATRQYEPIPERVAVVVRIFQMAAEGIGLHGIAAALQKDGVPTFGAGGRKAEFWGRSYVAKIIESPAVVGTFTPHTVEYGDGKKKRVPTEPITGYFPAIVDDDLYARVVAGRLGGRRPSTRTNKTEAASLLAGLAACPWCGSTMTRVSKGPKGGKPRLTCVRAKVGACRGVSVPQPDVERALAYWADSISLVPSGGADWEEEHHECTQKLIGIERLIATAANELMEGPSRALRDQLNRLEAEREEIVAKVTGINALAIAAGPALHRAAQELRAALKQPEPKRQMINGLLRQVFDAVTVDGDESELRFLWKHGVEQALPLHVPADQPVAAAMATPLKNAALRLLATKGH